MLIPKEKPYLDGLNSYYLYIDKFVEHLQGEIGSGCLYCKAVDQELLVYFDEREIVRGVIQKDGDRARVSQSLAPVLESLDKKSFQVTIYYLDPSSIFFWGQMPPFQRAKAKLKSTDITLPDLVFRLRQKRFSGFIDVVLEGNKGGGLLFFHQGERRGGSYSWGSGGISPADDDYNRLLGLLQTNVASYEVGHFKSESQEEQGTVQSEKTQPSPVADNVQQEKPMYFSNLETAMEEFMDIFIQVVRKKIKTDPLVQLKQKSVELVDNYPSLDPFRKYYEIQSNGVVEFAENAPREDIAAALVDCCWLIVEENRLQKKFRAGIKKWAYKTALEERGIDVER
jgi:hypothetical protein